MEHVRFHLWDRPLVIPRASAQRSRPQVEERRDVFLRICDATTRLRAAVEPGRSPDARTRWLGARASKGPP